MKGLRVQRGGSGDSVLLLLHGMGATGEVWAGIQELLPSRWPGRWIVPDLPGHGGSPSLARYSFGQLAAAVAAEVPSGARVTAVGHSLGGVVALALASGWFGVTVELVVGVGIKVVWTDDELAKAAALAARPQPEYPTREGAAERHLKLAGLAGLLPTDQVPDAALAETATGWTVRFDPAAFGMGAPPMAQLLAAARARVVLAAGERDPMSPKAHLEQLVAAPVILTGLGHNAPVEDPVAVWSVVERSVAG
ncbi:MAG: alpha/beta hydrolase [Gemmatimonadetes bacterium]|nr:alpha/beta hydrolase [Gemmatimonadota bacterium]